MSREERIKALALNAIVRGEDFEYFDPDNYIFASMSQPLIRVVDKKDTDDEMRWTVECPNCHRHVNYGTEIFMIRGYLYCSDEKCRREIWRKAGVKEVEANV